MLGVVLFCPLSGNAHEPQAHQLQALRLEACQHLAHQAALHALGLHNDQRPLHMTPRVAHRTAGALCACPTIYTLRGTAQRAPISWAMRRAACDNSMRMRPRPACTVDRTAIRTSPPSATCTTPPGVSNRAYRTLPMPSCSMYRTDESKHA